MPSAQPAERIAALELVFQHLAPVECAERMAETVPLLERSESQNLHLLVAREGQAVIGAMFLQALPGGMGVVWPPAIAPHAANRSWHEDALLVEAKAWLQCHGVRMAQALLSTEETGLAEPLRRHGYTCPTRLWYLRHDLDLSSELLAVPERLSWESYGQCDRELFHRTLLQSYQHTQDFPELNDRRSLDDIVLGLQAPGFDPERWWLAQASHQPVGVLVLSGDRENWELAYTGVVPEARRRGYGMELVRKAILEAKAAGVRSLTLSVDARNAAGLAVYRRTGFHVFGTREVFLALW